MSDEQIKKLHSKKRHKYQSKITLKDQQEAELMELRIEEVVSPTLNIGSPNVMEKNKSSNLTAELAIPGDSNTPGMYSKLKSGGASRARRKKAIVVDAPSQENADGIDGLDEDMLHLQDVEVEVRSDDELARRPHRALEFENTEISNSVQDRITLFNNLSPRGSQGLGEANHI